MTPRRATIGRAFRRIILGIVAAVVLLVAGVWVEHALPVELPRPTGPSPVGRTMRKLDAELTAWIWYPADHRERVAPYLPDSMRNSWTRSRPGFINLLTRRLARVRAHGVFDAPLSARAAPLPVLVFRGGGGGGALGFTTLFEELASRGYVVVALEGGYAANPEACLGRADEDECAVKLLTSMVTVIGSSIDGLAAISSSDRLLGGHLDLSALGVFGHSFGGAQAFAFCAADRRCRAGVNIDGRLFGHLDQSRVTIPFLWLLSDHGSAQDSVSRQIMGQIQSAYDRQPADSRMRIMIRGANHFTFSEDGAILKSGLFRGVLRLIGALGISGRRQIEVSAYALGSYFDASLKHTGGTDSALTSPSYPELVRIP